MTASCKSRILGQESISRMNGVCVVRFRHFDDFFYIQITLFRAVEKGCALSTAQKKWKRPIQLPKANLFLLSVTIRFIWRSSWKSLITSSFRFVGYLNLLFYEVYTDYFFRNGMFHLQAGIKQITEPNGIGVRIDSYVYEGYEIPIYYDPMIGKLIVWATNREYAIERMRIRILSIC